MSSASTQHTTTTSPTREQNLDGEPVLSPRLRDTALVIGWVAVVAPFVLELGAIARASHAALIRRVPDDAFYYLEIATRLVRGQGFTFDGIHETNGFHPLWQLLLVPIAALSDGDLQLRLVLVLGVLCSFAAVLLVVRVVWRLAGPGPALLGAVIASQFALRFWVNGMEGPAALLATALVLTVLVAAAERPEPRRFLLVGLACALLVLARLDFAVVVVLVPIALIVRLRSWRPGAWWTLGAAAIAVPFGGWWLLRWQHVLTVSAAVKHASVEQSIRERFGTRASWSYVQDLVDVGNGYVRELRVWPNTRGVVVSSGVSRLLAFGLIALAALGWVAAALRWSASRKLRKRALGPSGWAVLVVLAMLAVKACVDLVLASPWASAWYSAPQRLAAGFVVGGGAWCGVRWLSARAAPLAYAAVAALVVIAFPLNATDWKDDAHRQRGRDSWIEQIDLAADWTLRHGPEGRYGARDAGLLGHRLDGVHPVVNLDGLANDYDFADLVIDDAPLRRRVSAEGVDYFVGRVTNRERRDDLDCATVLWTSPGRPIGFDDSVEGYTVGRLYVLDVRGCRSTSGER